MLHINRKRLGFKFLALAASFVTLSAFSGIRGGGDSFTIYLNNKLLLQQYVTREEGVKSFQLAPQDNNGQLAIYYSHCGQTGTARSILLKDEQNKTIKEWHFPDAAGTNTAMTCPVKDVLGVRKGNGPATINLFYTSRELPNGRLLASVRVI